MSRYVVCYDVSCDARRRKLSQCLDGYGDRIQESVFELPVDHTLFKQCMKEITAIMNDKEDSLAIYRICSACDGKSQYLGVGAAMPRIGSEQVFIV